MSGTVTVVRKGRRLICRYSAIQAMYAGVPKLESWNALPCLP